MSQRITDAFLQARVDTVNRLLGNPEGAGYSTPGVVVLSGAYGGTGVHRYANESGGVSDLMGGHYTKREVAHFLQGMIQALYAVREQA